MRIGILAHLTCTTIPIIRSYESAGLLDCGRRRAGFREFGPEALEQVKLILACRSLRWSLPEIKSLMNDLKRVEKVENLRHHLQDLWEQLRRLDLLERKVEGGTLWRRSTTEDSSSLLKIGQLSEQTGLSRGALDTMVNNGLLSCLRRQSGYRDFHPSAIEQVECIVALRSLGYTIEQTKTVLGAPLSSKLAENIRASIVQRQRSLKSLAQMLQGLATSEEA